MRLALFIFFVTLILSCDNKTKETNNTVKNLQSNSKEEPSTKMLREHIEKLVPTINKAIGLPTLIYKPGTITDTSMLDEFRVTLQGGQSLVYIPNHLFRIFRTKYTSTYTFEAYSFHYNYYTIDSVKRICSIPLDYIEVQSFYRLLSDNAFNDHIEYTNYFSTGGGHAIYELFLRYKGEIREQKRVVKVSHIGFIDILNYCYNKAGIKRRQENI